MVHDPCNDPPLPRIIPLQRMTRAVQDLQPNTRYSLRLRSVSRFNVNSEWSEAIDFVTPPTSYKPPLPRPLLYEGHTSINVKSGNSVLVPFVDGDLTAWPKMNVVTLDNIHFSALFYAPGTIRLEWEWSGRSGPWPQESVNLFGMIELRDKESLLLVDKWEIPMERTGSITVPMHYSSDYEWRLRVYGPELESEELFLGQFSARVRLEGVETSPWELIFKEEDIVPVEPCGEIGERIAVGERGIYEQLPMSSVVFGELEDSGFKDRTWDPRIAKLSEDRMVSIGVTANGATPSRGLVVEEWRVQPQHKMICKERRTLIAGATNEAGLGNVAGVHAFDDRYVLWVGKGYSEENFGGDYGLMASLIELTEDGAVVRDRAIVGGAEQAWSFSANGYDFALTSSLNPNDGALLAYTKQENSGWDMFINTTRITRSGNSLVMVHNNVEIPQPDFPGHPGIAPISDTHYMVTYTTLDQGPPVPDGPRMRAFTIGPSGLVSGPTIIASLAHHMTLSQDGLAYVNQLARHDGGQRFTASYVTSERTGTSGRKYALNIVTFDSSLNLVKNENIGWPHGTGGSTQSMGGIFSVPNSGKVVAIMVDANNAASWRLVEVNSNGDTTLDEPMLQDQSYNVNYWNIDFVPYGDVAAIALSTTLGGSWSERPYALELPS